MSIAVLEKERKERYVYLIGCGEKLEIISQKRDKAQAELRAHWEAIVAKAKQAYQQEFTKFNEKTQENEVFWSQYREYRDKKNKEIVSLRSEHKKKHKEMHGYFEEAHKCYEAGDRGLSAERSYYGKKCKERCEAIRREIQKISDEIDAERERMKAAHPVPDSTALKRAKKALREAWVQHDELKSVYKQFDAELAEIRVKYQEIEAEIEEIDTEIKYAKS